MKICMIGSGYVGLVTGACLAEFGMQVLCVDKDAEKIRALQEGTIPFFEPGLEDFVKKNVKEGRLSFSTSIREGVAASRVIFIAVGTPGDQEGRPDLSFVENAAEEIAEYADSYKMVVTKSTVPVGTARWLKGFLDERRRGDASFDVVSNPEFLREGAAIGDFMRPDRVIIGSDSDRAIGVMKQIYSALYLIETPFVITSLETAELIKYASNAFLATKVSFINEIAGLCDRVGADVHDVARAMGLDGRIGRKFLHPGPGFGGSCFPKDTRALVTIGVKHDCDMEIVRATISVNEKQRDRMVEKIRNMVGEVKGKTLGVLGLAFKPNTDDMREAPSIPIIQRLQVMGATVKAYDPEATGTARNILENVVFCDDAYEVAENSDAVILMTEWNRFRLLDLEKIRELLRSPVFIDLRNVYEPDRMRSLGFHYCGVGR